MCKEMLIIRSNTNLMSEVALKDEQVDFKYSDKRIVFSCIDEKIWAQFNDDDGDPFNLGFFANAIQEEFGIATQFIKDFSMFPGGFTFISHNGKFAIMISDVIKELKESQYKFLKLNKQMLKPKNISIRKYTEEDATVHCEQGTQDALKSMHECKAGSPRYECSNIISSIR